jgi:hypothetical protein
MVPVAAALAVLLFIVNQRWRGTMAVLVLALVVYCVLLFANPLAAPRFQTASIVIGVVAIVAKRRLRTGFAAIVALLLGLFVGLPYLNVGRYSERVDVFRAFPATETMGNVVASGDFDAYSMLLATVWYVDRVGVTWGRQLVGVALFWVPRAWWEGKPLGSGRIVAEYLGFPNVNLSSPLPAEALINWGLLFVPVAALLFGAFLRRIDDLYWLSSGTAVRRIDLAYPLLLGMVFFVSRGDLMSGFAYTVGTTAAAVAVTVPVGLGRSVFASRR